LWAHAANRRLVTPRLDNIARTRRIRIETSHHRKAIGMRARRGNHNVVARTFEYRRDQHRAIDAGRIHFAQQIVCSNRLRLVRRRQVWIGCRPRPLRRVRRPDMHLRIDNQHDRTAMNESAEFKDGARKLLVFASQ
jgi:hypothetical protein